MSSLHVMINLKEDCQQHLFFRGCVSRVNQTLISTYSQVAFVRGPFPTPLEYFGRFK